MASKAYFVFCFSAIVGFSLTFLLSKFFLLYRIKLVCLDSKGVIDVHLNPFRYVSSPGKLDHKMTLYTQVKLHHSKNCNNCV